MRSPLVRTSLLLIIPAVFLWLVLASRSIGHLLIWDEAMQLCTLRSFLRGGDYFSNWFWRHPPLMSLLMYLFDPYHSGFDIRVEWLVIAIGALNMLLLVVLNNRTFGPRVALWSSLAYAAMPGTNLLGVWIKTDPLATTFGLLSLIFLQRNRVVASAMALGFSLLSKETGLFFMGAAMVTVLTQSASIRSPRNLLCMTFVPILMVAWWYLGFGSGLSHHTSTHGFTLPHLEFAVSDQDWAAPWWQYVPELVNLLSVPGLILAVLGSGLVIRSMFTRTNGTDPTHQVVLMQRWPLALLLPSYALISIIPSKVPWVVVCLLPAWATVIGIAITAVEGRPGATTPMHRTRLVLACLCMVLIAAATWRPDYETQLRQLVPGQWRGATQSREIANKLDEIAQPGDRILMTSFYYWEGLTPAAPCAVFTYYSKTATSCEFLMRDYRAPASNLLTDVFQNHINIAVLSPVPGRPEHELFEVFSPIFDRVTPCQGAFIFSTTPLPPPAKTDAPKHQVPQ